MTIEKTKSCEVCGSTIYQEHLDSGIARVHKEKLMCAHCLKDVDVDEVGEVTDMLEPIAFDTDDDDHSASTSVAIATATDSLGATHAWDESGRKRPLDPKNPGATRCRLFHAKLSEGALEFLNSQVNDWLDDHEDIVIKFATSSVGVFEGKHSEPAIFLTVFY